VVTLIQWRYTWRRQVLVAELPEPP